jgi:pyrophosphatase PpaX
MAKRKINCVNTVLFDLDDTLLDSYGARISALNEILARAGIKDITAEQLISKFQGSSFIIGLEKLAQSYHLREDLFIAYRRAYWLNKGRIRIYPGINEMLDSLKSKGFTLGIVTGKGRNFEFEGRYIGCTGELKEVGIYDYFSVVIGFEDVKEGKPHPEGVKAALGRLDSRPEETLFVGDSAADIQAALNAGCLSCHATWGITDKNGLPEKTRPHYTVKAPRDLFSLDCL